MTTETSGEDNGHYYERSRCILAYDSVMVKWSMDHPFDGPSPILLGDGILLMNYDDVDDFTRQSVNSNSGSIKTRKETYAQKEKLRSQQACITKRTMQKKGGGGLKGKGCVGFQHAHR